MGDPRSEFERPRISVRRRPIGSGRLRPSRLGCTRRRVFSLITDQLGVRGSYARNELPGFIDNVVNGAKDINSSTQQSALVSFLWQPNETISLRLTGLGQRIEADNNSNVFLDLHEHEVFGDLKNQVFIDEPFRKTIGVIAGTIDIKLDWATITSVTGYSNTQTDQRVDATTTYGSAPALLGIPVSALAGFDLNLNLDKFTQELRLTSKPGGAFLWQLGGFFTYERAANAQNVFLTQLNGKPFTGPNAILNTLVTLEIPSEYTEYAAFANATYYFTKAFSLSAGVRGSRNTQDFSENVTEGVLLPIANTPGSSDETVVDFMVSPKFQIDDTKMVYGRIATGYQPGGPNVALPGVPPSVSSTKVISYEAGLKSEWFDHKLLFDITGYHIHQSDIQVGTIVNTVSAIVNAGAATSNGLEFTIGFQPIKSLVFGINGAYTHATLDDDAPSLNGKAGDRLPFIPLFSGSFTADYYFPLWGAHSEVVVPVAGGKGATDGKDYKQMEPPVQTASRSGWNGHVGLGVRYVGRTRSQVESSPDAFDQDAYAALDLTADVSNSFCTVRIFARNVTDNRVYQTITPITDITGANDHLVGVPIQPRTVGIEVDFRF